MLIQAACGFCVCVQWDRVQERPDSNQPGLLLSSAHLSAALAATRPSLSKDDWRRYAKL